MNRVITRLNVNIGDIYEPHTINNVLQTVITRVIKKDTLTIYDTPVKLEIGDILVTYAIDNQIKTNKPMLAVFEITDYNEVFEGVKIRDILPYTTKDTVYYMPMIGMLPTDVARNRKLMCKVKGCTEEALEISISVDKEEVTDIDDAYVFILDRVKPKELED